MDLNRGKCGASYILFKLNEKRNLRRIFFQPILRYLLMFYPLLFRSFLVLHDPTFYALSLFICLNASRWESIEVCEYEQQEFHGHISDGNSISLNLKTRESKIELDANFLP